MPGKNTYRVTNTKHVVHSNRRVTNSRGKYGGFGGNQYRNTGVYSRNQLNQRRGMNARPMTNISPPPQRGLYTRRQTRPNLQRQTAARMRTRY